MNEYKKGIIAYFEFKVKARSKYVKGQFIEKIISGHYQIIAEEKNYLLLKDEDIEIPVAKRNIIKFEAKEMILTKN